MKKIILSLCALLLVSSFNLQQLFPSTRITQPSKLGFGISRGAGFTQGMYKHAVNLINAASGYYKDDVLKNMQYIKQGMEKLYGVGNQQFYILIQTQAQAVYAWYVYTATEDVWAEFSDVNIIYPGWSYLIYRNYGNSTNFTHMMPWAIGPGISDQLRQLINTVVNKHEADGECTCYFPETQAIGNELISKTNRNWSTVCDEHGVTQGYVKTTLGLWGTFQPKNCFYTLFVYS